MNIENNYIAKHDKLLRHLSAQIEVATPEYARVVMPLLDTHKNGIGGAHGGVIFSLADLVFGVAANTGRDRAVVNMMSSIEYLRPGMAGPLKGEARLVRKGGHVLNYDVHIYDGEGTLIAQAMISGYLTNVQLPG